MPNPRRASSVMFEAARAALSLAGVRQILQTSISVNSGAENTYTVTDAGTRRVACVHLGTGNGDIRFDIDAAAAATDWPVIPARYFVVDAEKGQVLHFFNTTGGAITVYLMEID